MIGEASDLVERHWPDIEALAERLLIKGRVNFLETDAGVEKALTYAVQRKGAQASKPLWAIINKGVAIPWRADHGNQLLTEKWTFTALQVRSRRTGDGCSRSEVCHWA